MPTVIHMEFKPSEIKWLAILDEIRRRISDGELQPGDQVPSALAIQSEFGVARRTADRVLDALKSSGLVYTVIGKGTFVADPPRGA